MANEENTPVAPIIPDLNRKEVVDRKSGDNFLDWDAYGTYVLAVRQWRFEPGKRNNPSWRAHVVVLSSTNEAYPVGRATALHFPVGRTGTATDPGRPERDDRVIDDFIRAVFRKRRGDASFDAKEAFKALAAKGKVDHDQFRFMFIRKPGNTVPILDKKTRQVNDVTFPKDTFEIAPEMVEQK
jgi:hypothetical protein